MIASKTKKKVPKAKPRLSRLGNKKIKVAQFHKICVGKGLKLSLRRYQQLAAERKVDQPQKGEVEPIGAAISLAIYYQKVAQTGGGPSLTEARTKKEIARAEREEILVRRLRENLAEEAFNLVAPIILEAKKAFREFPRRMAPVVTPITDERLNEIELSKGMDKILSRMAKAGNALKHPGGRKS